MKKSKVRRLTFSNLLKNLFKMLVEFAGAKFFVFTGFSWEKDHVDVELKFMRFFQLFAKELFGPSFQFITKYSGTNFTTGGNAKTKPFPCEFCIDNKP